MKRVSPAPPNFVDAVFCCTSEVADYADPQMDEKTLEFDYPADGHALLGNHDYCATCFGISWSAGGVEAELNLTDGTKVKVIGFAKWTWYREDDQDVRKIVQDVIWEKVQPGLYVGKRVSLE